MAVSQRMDLRQSQTLVMTPQLQQAIKLLELSNLELAAYVEGELEQNPLLERADADGLRVLDQTLAMRHQVRDFSESPEWPTLASSTTTESSRTRCASVHTSCSQRSCCSRVQARCASVMARLPIK